MGDKKLKVTEQKISCEAEVRQRQITAADRYLVLGCDGIFEKVTSQALCDFLLPRLQKKHKSVPLSSICSAFLDVNIAKDPTKEQGLGCDNMTLMMVDLQAGNGNGAVVTTANAGVTDSMQTTCDPGHTCMGKKRLRTAAPLKRFR